MQEHIKLPLHPDTCSTDGWSTYEHRVLREFAQAVARECADICDQRAVELGTRWSGADVSPDASSCAALIRARFGLEG
jgi:hypothetical protein